ncbi:MAG: dTDP-4-dehydrorhamnose 3,5-epimerase family protein [Thermoleophilia bacterium]
MKDDRADRRPVPDLEPATWEKPKGGHIDGVVVKSLRVIPDDRGRLMEIFRSDDELFAHFGQIYMTTTYPGVVKAWHMHRQQTDHMCALSGMFRLALFDARKGSPTRGVLQEIYMGEHRPVLVRIPPGIYHGWRCVSEREGLVVNVPDRLYDYDNPDEFRLPPDTDQIGYDWERRNG